MKKCERSSCLKLVPILLRRWLFCQWCNIPVNSSVEELFHIEHIKSKLEAAKNSGPYHPDKIDKLIKDCKQEPTEHFLVRSCICQLLDKLGHWVEEQLWIDYCCSHPKTRIVNIYPIAYKQLSIVKYILKQYGTIHYTKVLSANRVFLKNMIWVYYYKDTRMGPVPKKSSFWYDKTQKTYYEGNPMVTIVYEPKKLDTIRDMKELIRDTCKHGFHSVHINDTIYETIQMAKCLLNNNSNILYNSRFYKVNHERMALFFGFLKQYMTLHSDIQNSIILDLSEFSSSAFPNYEVMSSFIEHENHFKKTFGRLPRKLRKFSDEQLYDPKFYTYLFGVKCVL